MPSRLWGRWKRIAHRAAEVQSLVVLALLYWIVVVPVGLLRTLGRRPSARAEWTTRRATGPVPIGDARRQY